LNGLYPRRKKKRPQFVLVNNNDNNNDYQEAFLRYQDHRIKYEYFNKSALELSLRFHTSMVTLAAGAFGFSISLSKTITESKSIYHAVSLLIVLGFSLLSALLSLKFSKQACEEMLDKLDKDYEMMKKQLQNKDKEEEQLNSKDNDNSSSWMTEWIIIFESYSILFLIVGSVLLIYSIT